LGALFAALLLSAGCDSDSKGDENVAGDTASDPTGDTASDDPGDTVSDPGDTASDPGDTASDDPGDTATDDPGDTASDDPGDTASDPKGDTETDDPGDTASDDPSDTDTNSETPPPVCTSGADCTEPGLGVCIVATGECVACVDDEDCPGLDVCNANTCEASGWLCPIAWYGDSDCDCGCGALDIDCIGPESSHCENNACPLGELIHETQNWTCEASDWFCTAHWYGDGLCDCGCGAPDIDCQGPENSHCDYTEPCDELGLAVDPDENWHCYMATPECSVDDDCTISADGPFCDNNLGGKCVACLDDAHCADGEHCVHTRCIPAGWTCPAFWYGDGDCDCGCGALDADCQSPEVSACGWHFCPKYEQPDPTQNWLCNPVMIPAEWICPTSWFLDGDCHCGCGALDADCEGAASIHCRSTYICDELGLSVDSDENWRCIDP
jgi:hypothetical protein